MNQDKPDRGSFLELKRNLARFLVHFDPMIIGLARHNLYGNFSDPFRCKPGNVILILSDPHPEICMSMLNFGNGLDQLIFGDIPFDPSYHRYE